MRAASNQSHKKTESRHELYKPCINHLAPAQDILWIHQVLAHRQRPHDLWPPYRPAALWRTLTIGPCPRSPGKEEEEADRQLKPSKPAGHFSCENDQLRASLTYIYPFFFLPPFSFFTPSTFSIIITTYSAGWIGATPSTLYGVRYGLMIRLLLLRALLLLLQLSS